MKLKKLVAMFIALVMVLGMTGMPASAEDATATALDQFAYDQDDANLTVTLTDYTGDATEVVVPGTYDIDGTDYAVIIDAANIFMQNTSITSVTINEGVTFKDDSMRGLFYGCTALTTVDMDEVSTTGVTDMSFLFNGCKVLTSVDVSNFDTSLVEDMSYMFSYCLALIPDGYQNWDTGNVKYMVHTFERVFYDSALGVEEPTIDLSAWDMSKVENTDGIFQNARYLEKVALPETLKIINAFAFNHVGINTDGVSVIIPKSVEKIGYCHVFHDFGPNGQQFELADGHEHFMVEDGILYSKDYSQMVSLPKNKTFENHTYVIPEGVKFMGELSFSYNSDLQTIVIPDSYEFIQYAELYDERYTDCEPYLHLNGSYIYGSNGNHANSLTLATYFHTNITDYVTKDTNPNYASHDGILYTKDMKEVLAIPARYDRVINVPEGVTKWNQWAMWSTAGTEFSSWKTTVDSNMKNCSGVNIPSTLTDIASADLQMLDRLIWRTKKGESGYSFNRIEVAAGNPIYSLDADGYIVADGIDANRVTVAQPAGFDGTPQEPEVTVTAQELSIGANHNYVLVNDITLEEGTDYTVEYLNNDTYGVATAVITGIGAYRGTVTKEFTIGVAQIGDTGYATLAEAVEAANDMEGDVTITLLADATYAESMVVDSNITINGAGFTLSPDELYTGNLFTVNTDASLTIDNLTIDGLNEWTYAPAAKYPDTYDSLIEEDILTGNCYPTQKAKHFIEADGATRYSGNLIIGNSGSAIILNGSTIKNYLSVNINNSGPYLIKSSGLLEATDSQITHCASISDLIQLSQSVLNEGTEVFGCYAGGNGILSIIGESEFNGVKVYDNRCFTDTINVLGGDLVINDCQVYENVARRFVLVAYAADGDAQNTTYSSIVMYDGSINNNVTQYRALVDSNCKYAKFTIYGGEIVDNECINLGNKTTGYNPIIHETNNTEGYGVTLYGGVYDAGVVTYNITTNEPVAVLDDYCAPGYTVVECADGRCRVIKVMNIEFEDVTADGVEGEKLYNINLIASEGDVINRLNSADLTFAFDKDSDMAYEIIAPENGEIEINNVEGDRYEFHYKDKEDDVTSDTGAKITIGQVKITGFGAFSFSVDANADTNAAHATELEDNIVDSFIASGNVGEDAVAGGSYLDISNKIEDEIIVPLKNLTVNITFPNKVEYNAAAYQDMKLTVTGGAVDKVIELGNAAIDETLDDAIVNPAVVTLVDNYFENGYSVSLNLPYNTTYTVAVEGAGYRTSRYSVTLSEDKVLNFWNNVKDNAVEIEEGLTSSAVKHNFVAGDIITDNEVNIYDLSAVISYFATENDRSAASEYAKYDLDRNGVIDSKDVAYVLVSWGN